MQPMPLHTNKSSKSSNIACGTKKLSHSHPHYDRFPPDLNVVGGNLLHGKPKDTYIWW